MASEGGQGCQRGRPSERTQWRHPDHDPHRLCERPPSSTCRPHCQPRAHGLTRCPALHLLALLHSSVSHWPPHMGKECQDHSSSHSALGPQCSDTILPTALPSFTIPSTPAHDLPLRDSTLRQPQFPNKIKMHPCHFPPHRSTNEVHTLSHGIRGPSVLTPSLSPLSAFFQPEHVPAHGPWSSAETWPCSSSSAHIPSLRVSPRPLGYSFLPL